MWEYRDIYGGGEKILRGGGGCIINFLHHKFLYHKYNTILSYYNKYYTRLQVLYYATLAY